MATISSTGIGSGLDVNAIVSQLMAIESRPLTLLQQAKSDLSTQLSAVGRLQSLTSAMRDAAQRLTSVSLWNATGSSSADATSVGVTTGSGAIAGSYSVAVQNLASGQTVTSRTWANSTTAVGQGTLTIELGAWTGNAAPADFSPKSGAQPLVLNIGPGETSLSAIRDKINAAGAGVTATLVNDAGGTRLALRSTETGAENAFRIRAVETTDDGDATTGLSALAFDAGGAGPSQMTRYETARNAEATVNGIPISSASNKLEGVADGLTLTLLKTTTAPVAVTVTRDDAGVKGAVDAFVKAFNDLAIYLRDNTKYDEQAKKGGTLQGDRTALGLQTALRNVINESSSASSVFGRLSDVGITLSRDGLLSVNASKLAAGLDKRDELRKLFAGTGATSASQGFMTRFSELGAKLLDIDGALDSRSDSLNAMIARNTRSQESMNDRLAQTEARLRRQYQALDTTMAKAAGLSNYLSGQLAMLSNNGG